MTRFTGPLLRRSTSPGAHALALWWALTTLIDEAGESSRRVKLRTVRAMLERAYHEYLMSDVDIAQYMAEEDGDGVSEAV